MILYYLQQMDDRILMAIQSLHNPILDVIMPLLSLLGNLGMIWFFAAALLLIRKEYRKYSLMIVLAIATAYLVGELMLKPFVGRPRPCQVNEMVPMLVPVPGSYSFPSGHSASSFAAAMVLLFDNKKFGVAGLVLAVLIAFSRMYLYVHYPTDVAAGILLGILSAFLVRWIYQKLERHKEKRQEE